MRCLLASLPVLALACGGTIHPIDPSALHIEGSYDFTVSSFTVTNQQGYPPPTTTHPAIGQHARLDIRKNGSGYDAYVTPDFADPAQMNVILGSDGDVTLRGQVNFNGPTNVSYASASDELDAIHLAVGADGHLAGTFTAEGQENVFEGDVGWTSQGAASGAIGHDARPPVANPNVSSTAPVTFPWDSLYARISEPVDAKLLANAISLSPASGTSNVSWQVGPSVDWLGGVSITGYRTSWSDFAGPATLSVAGGLGDPSGNVSTASATPVSYLDVPKAASFSGATVPALFGASQVAYTPDACGSASSCFEIGPITGPCSADSGGIAGRLGSGSTFSITFRARVAKGQYGSPYMMGPIGVSVAVPGSPAQNLQDPSLGLTFSATNDPAFPYASDWVTAKVALPISGSEVGFAVLPFANETMYCGGGPALMPITLVLDVAEVTTLP